MEYFLAIIKLMWEDAPIYRLVKANNLDEALEKVKLCYDNIAWIDITDTIE